jgi:YD repeat-containing protein
MLLLVALCATGNLAAQTDVVRTGRFIRGGGTNASYHSFVVALDMEKGLACANTGGAANLLYPWNATGGTLYHYDASNPASSTNLGLRIPFVNPVAGFGSRPGGTSLYIGQQYRFGLYSGQISPHFGDSLRLHTFSTSGTNWTYLGMALLPLPNPANAAEWGAYLTNGYTRVITTNGLTTVISFDQTYLQWGVTFQGAIMLTHAADASASNKIYQIELAGLTDKGDMVKAGNGAAAWSRMYTLEFEQRPPWRAVFIDAPHFDGEPLPSFFQGKSTEELLTNTPPVTTTFSLPNPPNYYTNLDHSPELRRHPILDQFVADLRRDPVALARFVHNEIGLTDAVSYNDNGSLSEISINPPGVARGALATFQEGQGGPAEQCALLVYLLRQAGVPAVYVYPPHNGLKLLDTRLSKLLRIQFKGAVNAQGQTYTSSRVIPVNYPWVAAYVGSSWVHLFPWLKDTSLEEGLNLYDYTGASYRNGFQWVRDYMYGAGNIFSLATDDDTAGVLFPLFVKQNLSLNAPGLSLDDIGMRVFDRANGYARWQDFPAPLVTPATGVALDSLSSSAITNVFPALTNIFDLFQVEIRSAANTNKVVSSGLLRMVDLHNRRFVARHEKTGANTHKLILSLAALRPGATGPTNFAAGDALLNSQQVSVALNSSDDALTVTMIQLRQRSLPADYGLYPPSPNITYPGLYANTIIADQTTMRKGDLAAICVNVGGVSRSMLNVHAQDLWNMERTLKANPSGTNTVAADLYQGGPAYLTGMSYFENVSRTEQMLQRLHKVQIISHYGHGLAKLSAKRVSGQLPNQGDIVLTQPNVDMAFRHSAIAFNGSIHSQSGDEQFTALTSFRALWAAHGSSEEHQILNSFYRESDSVSTMKLLRLAQSRSSQSVPGIFALNYLNYTQLGNSNINGTLLKNFDPAVWLQVTNWLSRYDARVDQVFMTPGAVTNQSNTYRGVGAFLWSPGGQLKAIITPNLNGGFAPFVPDQSFTAYNSPNISIGLDPNNNFFVTLTAASGANPFLAPDAFASYNAASVISSANAGYYNYSGFQTAWTGEVMDYLGLGSLGSQSLNFGQSIQADEGNSGFLGWLSDGLSQMASGVADPVHAVTGEFYVNAADVALPGPMPLVVSRNHSSLNPADNQFGFGWKLNYMPYLSLDAAGTIIYAAEADGAVIAYEQTSTNANVFLPAAAKNPQLNNHSQAGIGSTANRMRNRIQRVVGSGTYYYLYAPDGGKRTFKVMTFAGGVNRTRPYLQTWEDQRGNCFTVEYGTDPAQPDYAEARRVQSSNGNYLGFRFDVYGHIIEAYTGDGRRIVYEYDSFGDLVNVTLPDQSRIGYEYEHKTQLVNGKTVPYSTHLLIRENKPDGRVLVNQYDAQRRVTNQLATVGADLNPVRNATFVYSNNFNPANSFTNTITGSTFVIDINGKTNKFFYDRGLITNITDTLNQTITQDWFDPSETNKAGYYPRSLEFRIDARGLKTSFQYDANGNITNRTLRGDLTGDGILTQQAVTSTTYNSNSLPLTVIDPVGNRTQFVYHTNFIFLPQRVARLVGATPVSTNWFDYYSVTNTFAQGGTTLTNLARGLTQREIRAQGSPDSATTEWTHDGRGFVTRQTAFSGTADPNVVLNFFYNSRGELVEQVDAANRTNAFDYDGVGRLKWKETFSETGAWLSGDYFYYNENGELIWTDGPRFNPEDYVWRDYDGAGRKTIELRWRSQAKYDGSGVEAPMSDDLYAATFFQYDGYGNLTNIVDPVGNRTAQGYDTLGRMTRQVSYSASGTAMATNLFAYEPGGQVSIATNAAGGITRKFYTSTGQLKRQEEPSGAFNEWRYDLAGRPVKQALVNNTYWQHVYDDLNRRVTSHFKTNTTFLATNVVEFDRRGNTVKRTDAEGYTFTTTFDDLDRVKVSAGPIVITTSPGVPGGGGGTVTNQQIATYTYDASGKTLTVQNALGEKTITTQDAAGRPVRVEHRAPNNAIVRVQTTGYSIDHHSVTATNGTGTGAIVSTAYTDNVGQPLLDIGYPAAGTREYVWRKYDRAGNRIAQRQLSWVGGTTTLWSTNGYTYDGLNRVATEISKDGATMSFGYHPLGGVTNRTMHNGLVWSATYRNDGQMASEQIAGGGLTARSHTYQYYPSGNSWAGLLQTVTDGRGTTRTHKYDAWLRLNDLRTTGAAQEQQFARLLNYDRRGLITGVTEAPVYTATGPVVQAARIHDGYGQIVSERVYLDDVEASSASQRWDDAGRRSGLGGNSFSYRADGLLTGNSGAIFNYGDNGLLTSRVNGARTVNITQRDGMGRILQASTVVNAQTGLSEVLAWYRDGRIDTYTATRSDFTDSRLFTYASLTRRLTQERLYVASGQQVINTFGFDLGASAGLGVLTSASASGQVVGTWSVPGTGGLDGLRRVATENNTVVKRFATGKALGAAAVTATLDNKPVSVSFNGAAADGRWRSTLELTPGSHTLRVSAAHPSGQYTAGATNTFTLSVAGADSAVNQFDGNGNVTKRIWKNASGQTNRTQTLTWDAFDRLVKVTDRDAVNSGFDWVAAHDTFSRRIRTKCTLVVSNTPITNPASAVSVVISQYDPQVEFSKLGSRSMGSPLPKTTVLISTASTVACREPADWTRSARRASPPPMELSRTCSATSWPRSPAPRWFGTRPASAATGQCRDTNPRPCP